MTSIGDKVIFTVCRESNKYDKNNSDRLGRAIHLKPQNLSYPNSWLVVVEALCVLVCLCGSLRFLVVLDGFFWFLGCSWWFLGVLAVFFVVLWVSLWFLVVLGRSWWFLVVLSFSL